MLLWARIALVTLGLIAQSVRAERLPIRAYTTTEGLPHNHVSRIYRDSHDFLWICTDEGLSRFDGHQFVNYTTSSGLPHIHVNDIIETRAGEYWIATDGGVTWFRPSNPRQKFTTFKPQGAREALFANTLIEEPDGGLLVGTVGGLYRLSRENGQVRLDLIDLKTPGVTGPPPINALLFDKVGVLWVGSSRGLYRRDTNGQWDRFNQGAGLPHDFVDKLVMAPDGRIWACTRYGLARLAQNPHSGDQISDLTFTDSNGLPHGDVRTILFASDGHRWIGTAGGLVEWQPGAERPDRSYAEEDGLTDRAVYTIAEDRLGNLWLGSRRGGLMRLSKTGFRTFSEVDGLSFGGDQRLIETRSGEVCVAALFDPRRSIRCYDGSAFHTFFPRLPASLTERKHGSQKWTLEDHQGDWWLSTENGVFRFSRPTSKILLGAASDLHLLAGVDCPRVFEDSRGDLWISTQDKYRFGVMLWRRATRQVVDLTGYLTPYERGLGVTAFTESKDGQIWLGMARPGGVLRWAGDGFQEIPGVPGGTVNALFSDRAGRVWVATAESGLALMEKPSVERPLFRTYGRAEGLSSNEIWSVAEDGYGRIYAGTARGVDYLDPATGRVVQYDSADGLAKGDIRSALTDRRGDLWFLSNQGLSRFRPAQESREPAVVTRIMAVRIGGAPEPLSELGEINVGPLVFPWNRNSVQIEFSAIDYSSPDQLRYQFRLDGTNQDWSPATPNPTVNFPNLPDGKYRLLVRAIGADAPTGSAPASCLFTITPAPWRRWWFQAAVAALIAAGIYALHLYRVRQAVAVERVRTRLATDLHDDLGAGLAEIAILSEVARRGASDGAGSALADAAARARSLRAALSDIVWTVDPTRDHLADLISRMRETALTMLENENQSVQFTAPSETEIAHIELPPDLRRHLLLFFKESVTNIARHAGASAVSLELLVNGRTLRMRVRDNGRGFDPEKPAAGRGLSSLRYRTEEMKGTLRLSSTPGQGTEIELSVIL